MKRSHAFLIFLLAALAGCRSPAQVSRTAPRAAQEDDIREAVLRYQIGSPTSAPHTDAAAQEPSVTPRPNDGDVGHRMYFLSLGNNKDPSDELMRRFQGSTIPIKKVSESYWDKKGKLCCQVKEKGSNTLGLIYSVSNIRWLDDDTVKAQSGYIAGGLFARSNTYTLAREGDKWKVQHIEYGPVS